jgi:hypothetical protein
VTAGVLQDANWETGGGSTTEHCHGRDSSEGDGNVRRETEGLLTAQ